MNNLTKFWKNLLTPTQPREPGVYHYQAPADAPAPYRLHLRIEPGGEGVLIINASTVLHLNQTATEYAFHLVQGDSDEQAAVDIARRYRVKKDLSLEDYRGLKERIERLIQTPDLDPVSYLDFERLTPYTAAISAPYRIDCALTYLTSTGGHNIAPVERVRRELVTDEWKTILSKAWDAGVPHVIFTGGEPTLRSDLPDLIAYAEQLGQVTGLLTDGLRLTDPEYLHSVLNAGLDHLMILLDTDDEQSWEALRDVLPEDIFTTVHLTVNYLHEDQYETVLDRLAAMGVRSLSLSTSDLNLKEKLQTVRDLAGARDLALVWDLPVPYSARHPVALELAESHESPPGAGKAWLYVEPDGDVLASQGQTGVLGNLLNDDWNTVYHPH